MSIGGIHGNGGIYGQRPPQRPGSSSSAPRPDDATEHSNAPPNQHGSSAQRRGVAQYTQHLPDPEQYKKFKEKAERSDDSFDRYLGISLGASRAINTYHQMETQQRREEITQMLGLDVYV
ncbi:MAG: hypothetical protein OEW58_12740 [Gammaproteobacteria bacterium]|nr:hypothetical protein [Gammaproteobacteria bacterium]